MGRPKEQEAGWINDEEKIRKATTGEWEKMKKKRKKTLVKLYTQVTLIYCFILQKQQMQQTANLFLVFGTLWYQGPELHSCEYVDPFFSSSHHLLGVYHVPSTILDALGMEMRPGPCSQGAHSLGERQTHPQTNTLWLVQPVVQARTEVSTGSCGSQEPTIASCVHMHVCVWQKEGEVQQRLHRGVDI